MTASGQDRFEAILREQARRADGDSAIGAGPVAERDVLRADWLRRVADEFRTNMSPEQLQMLDTMSDDTLRALVTGARLLAPWIRKTPPQTRGNA